MTGDVSGQSVVPYSSFPSDGTAVWRATSLSSGDDAVRMFSA